MLANVLQTIPALTTSSPSPLPPNPNQFFNVDNFKAITFLFLFAVSFLFSIGLFTINLYKTLKVTTEQKHLFHQASISMRRDNVEKDQFMQIGRKITTAAPSPYSSTTSATPPSANVTLSSSSSSSSSTATANNSGSQQQHQQSKKDR
ncbi:hypothetical protein TYRP_016663 [Tyrophagus putrescentiae]|nr:hypothetical protein TYRP_016663 [Tyrophagus putrescentiae]